MSVSEESDGTRGYITCIVSWIVEEFKYLKVFGSFLVRPKIESF